MTPTNASPAHAPIVAPTGTQWFGGPVHRFQITLRISGEKLDPAQVSALLGCFPTRAERAGVPLRNASGGIRIPARGLWSLELNSRDLPDNYDLDDGIRTLLGRLPSTPDIWTSLNSTYKVEIFCGLYMASANRGFSIPPDVADLLAERGIAIEFDLYINPPK